MTKKRILIISANGDESTTGYATRVLQVAKTLVDNGHTVKLVRFYPFQHPRSWVKTCQYLGFQLAEIPMLPMSRFAIARWITVIIANLFTYLLAFYWRANAIQAESHDAALIALWIKWSTIPVLVDIHGAAPEEAMFLDKELKRTKNRNWLQLAERLIIEKSDIHFVVSQHMINHLKNKHKKIKSSAKVLPISVNPSLFPLTDYHKAKNSLGIDPDKIVVAYCGGDQSYQCLTEMYTILKIICATANVHILILSKSAQRFSDLFSSLPCSKSYICAPHNEVSMYLNAADYGLLIRRDELLNRVSCPTKFAEYLACGLAVLTTPWAGHGPSIVENYAAGMIIDPDSIDTNSLQSYLKQKPNRTYLRQIAVEHLSWPQASKTLIDSYL